MECQHNLHYWNLDPYLAFGPSAHGFDGKSRFSNISNLDMYINKNEQKQSVNKEIEALIKEKDYLIYKHFYQ